ncbi:elongation factor Ts [Candidatus Parcubacteria bacterium]|nr:elongation factor Ts [Candidatus Parcubacteria bacterium]
MAITTEDIKELRDQTGVSVMQCKKALEEAGGDKAKALLILKKKSADIAAKKGDRALGAGAIASYLHGNGTVGVLVELSSETDFVAKNEEFRALAYDIAMQVAATSPEFVRAEDIAEKDRAAVREMFEKETAELKKDEAMKEKILSGKVDAYFKDRILLEQAFIKDDSLTIRALIERAVQKFGERIEVARIARFAVGK